MWASCVFGRKDCDPTGDTVAGTARPIAWPCCKRCCCESRTALGVAVALFAM